MFLHSCGLLFFRGPLSSKIVLSGLLFLRFIPSHHLLKWKIEWWDGDYDKIINYLNVKNMPGKKRNALLVPWISYYKSSVYKPITLLLFTQLAFPKFIKKLVPKSYPVVLCGGIWERNKRCRPQIQSDNRPFR